MFPVSRVGDVDHEGGVLVVGVPNVIVSWSPVAIVTTPLTDEDAVVTGSPTVFVSGMPVARLSSITSRRHTVVTGTLTVFVP